MERERKRKGPMGLMPPSGHPHPAPFRCGGGSGPSQDRAQGRQHSDVDEHCAASFRSVRGHCVVASQAKASLIKNSFPRSDRAGGSGAV
jgi:hypothetical protein